MYDNPQALSGPDFLDEIADTANGEGLDINAHTYRQYANQWRDTKAALDRAIDTIAALERRLESATQALAA